MKILSPAYTIFIAYDNAGPYRFTVSLLKGKDPEPVEEYHGRKLRPALLKAIEFIVESEKP